MDKSTVVPQKRKSRVWMFWTASIGFIFVIAMAIETLWHDKYFGVAQNESAAVGGLRKINTLENQYAASHADKGFACELSLLRPIEAVTDPYDPTSALLGGKWSGYRFSVFRCTPGPNGIVLHYEITAVPVRPYSTGVRAFCTDESGKIFYDHNSSLSQCLASRQVIPN
jgi:hypothetical protein